MPDGLPKTDGIALGQATAAAVLARRADDGSTVTVPYVPGSGPGVWIPTPPASAPALLPHWRSVVPWTMTAPEQFRPGPPPALDSATYTADFTEMKAIGETNSTTRTAEQTAIGLFHIEVPPFTLGSAARSAVAARPLPLIESARLFALLNMAMADALIAVWDGKFHDNYWRPVTAIRVADTDGNPATELDSAWTPLRATPPHPEYPAAHTIIAAAGAAVLASVFGDEFTFTIESPTLPGQPRTFARFSDFPVESSNARVWAGFHWRNSTVVAAQMGAAIGQQAVAKHLRNTQPPTFTKITEGDIVTDGGRSAGCAWGDYNGDGFEDLFVANNNGENDFLYRNNGDGTFSRVTSGAIVNDGADSVSANWGDFDNDGDLDLFVSNGGGFAAPQNNCLCQNNGEGSFARIVTGSIVTDNLFTLPAAWGDYDNDGRLDLFVDNGGGAARPHFLYRNLGGGSCTKITSGCIVTETMIGIGSAWGDYDNDGFLDLFVCWQEGKDNHLYHNNGDATFTRVLTGSLVNDGGNSPGCAWADYDNDGFLDLFVSNGAFVGDTGQDNFLYRNDGNGNRWLKVKLVGGSSNRAAIGAKVRLTASIGGARRTQMRQISAGSGFASQNSLVVPFGLGTAMTVETVRIEWPSGIVQEWHDVVANQFLTVTEPPRLQAAAPQPDGSFQLLLTGASGLRYDLETSGNLAAWTFWQTVTNTSRTISITDSNAPGFTQRFYRAVGQ